MSSRVIKHLFEFSQLLDELRTNTLPLGTAARVRFYGTKRFLLTVLAKRGCGPPILYNRQFTFLKPLLLRYIESQNTSIEGAEPAYKLWYSPSSKWYAVFGEVGWRNGETEYYVDIIQGGRVVPFDVYIHDLRLRVCLAQGEDFNRLHELLVDKHLEWRIIQMKPRLFLTMNSK